MYYTQKTRRKIIRTGQSDISAEKNSEEYKRPEKTQVNNETKEAEKSIINTNYSLGDSISDTMREVDIVNMPKKKFMLYNLTGSLCWVALMMLGGHFLQSLVQKD